MLNLGKREAGLLTAANPGDTLIFPFTVVDGTGQSVTVDSGFDKTDVEIFKNGQPTPRATDSGVSLISDTGMMGDLIGLYRISVQPFNTSDDATFFDTGASYQVAVVVVVGGLTRRQWLGSFELGRPGVNIRSVLGDTGAAHLDQGRFGVIADSGHIQGSVDTGKVSNAVWDTLRADHTAAGSFGRDLLDSGMAATVVDTGKVSNAVWNTLRADHTTAATFGRDLADSGMVAAVMDTGKAANAVWRSLTVSYGDTGSFGEELGKGVNIVKVAGDTGAAKHLQQAFDLQGTDTGLVVDVAAIRVQTDKLQFDTGANELHADIRKVNNVQVDGNGSAGNEWGPV